MTIEINKNTIISGLMGIMIGSGGTYGVQSLKTSSTVGPEDGDSCVTEIIAPVVQHPATNYDMVPYDEYGDVIITPTGTKYHHEGCSYLRGSSRTRQVNSEDAAKAGFGPCSACIN